MKPKGIRKAGYIHAQAYGYSGIAVDILSSICVDLTQISEIAQVNEGQVEESVSISEGVVVGVT